jgi:regulatory protein
MAQSVYDYCLKLLTVRAYTVRDLSRKLSQRGFATDEIHEVIERLVGAGLVDDSRYASEYARQKLLFGGAAARRVRQGLISRGISDDVAKSAIETILAEETIDMKQSADAAARKKLATMGDLDHHTKRRRLFAFLARRGFDVSDIRRAVDETIPVEES